VNSPPDDGGQPDEAEERMQSYLDEVLLALRGRPREAVRRSSPPTTSKRSSATICSAQCSAASSSRRGGPCTFTARHNPAVLPAGFNLTVCGPLLGVVAAFLLGTGICAVALGINSAGGPIGSGDLVATGATVMTTALLCWVALARQATRPARNLTIWPQE
jgi:hypothetical protein